MKVSARVEREAGCVAGDDQHPLGFRRGEARCDAGQWARECGFGRVAVNREAVAPIQVRIPVRTDRDRTDLRLQARDGVLDQGLSAQRLEALVDAAHARTLSSRENQAGDQLMADPRAPGPHHPPI